MSSAYTDYQPAPAVRVMEVGPAALSDLELIAAVTGSVTTAGALLARFGSVGQVFSAQLPALSSVTGVGPAVAARVASVREAWRRVSYEQVSSRVVSQPDQVYDLLEAEMSGLEQESVRVLMLNARKFLIGVKEIFRGTQLECFAAPQDILRAAIVSGAAAIVVAHNHPAGNPSPSMGDHRATETIKAACVGVGVEFTDHVIIGRRGDWGSPYFSFREAGLL